MSVEQCLNSRSLKILFIDDSEDDVVLTKAEIERSGYEVHSRRVQTANGVKGALKDFFFDCIICDHKMPGFSSIEALWIVRGSGFDTPFLIVSGVIGEEAAVEAMRAGAHDYMMKNNLLRLVPAIEREIREAKTRMDIRRSYERLKESERRFRTLAEAAPILIWVTGPNMTPTYINRRWIDYLGFVVDDPSQLRWKKLVHPDDIESVSQAVRMAYERKSEFSIEFRLRRTDGEWRYVRDSGAPRLADNGSFEGFVGTVVDLTDVVQARLEAESASRSKSAFLANMSHEIRTPLGAILGFADLLREEDISTEERKYYLDIIVRNGNELLRIIGDILDLSKIEAGKLAFEISLFRLRELINEVTSLLSIKADEKGIGLEVQIDAEAPEWIESDRTRLRQILINIIGNAIKFTTNGQVRVSVKRSQVEPGARQLIRIAVEDTGPGIPEEKKVRLFQTFSQGDTSTTREFGGSGLGLVLARHMARGLNGDVILENSSPGFGSCFVITVAAQQAIQASAQFNAGAAQTTPNKLRKPLEGLNVLLVEDLMDNQILVRNWLERNGAVVETAVNGEEGIRMALSGKYQVVLMDIHMPVLDGLMATKSLRNRGFRAPIVALTAHAMKEDREKIMSAGFNGYLTKPLNLRELVKTVRQLTVFQ